MAETTDTDDPRLAKVLARTERLRAYIRGRGITPCAIRRFRGIVLDHYRLFGRDLPWRRTRDPYHVLVSEIMLQQTQVPRVETKFPEFLEAFSTVEALAKATTPRLLGVWRGMGYNRRALALREAARAILEEHSGRVPEDPDALRALPGIGPATTASIRAFAFDIPSVVVETNIRAVLIHVFFDDSGDVSDEDIEPLVARTLDRRRPRDWYNAMMDFGVLLKRIHGNPARRAKAYRRQSPFEGSNRQARSRILRYVMDRGPTTAARIARDLGIDDAAAARNLAQMSREGLVTKDGRRYRV